LVLQDVVYSADWTPLYSQELGHAVNFITSLPGIMATLDGRFYQLPTAAGRSESFSMTCKSPEDRERGECQTSRTAMGTCL